MLVPVYLGLCQAADLDAGHQAAAALVTGNLITATVVSVVHTAAMIVSGGVIAIAVYRWLGPKFISQSWFNLDIVWAVSLILVGGIGIASIGYAR
jgi:CBS domain containing-hemolysin-like protein